jgi:collagenase-like PrtC family protease
MTVSLELLAPAGNADIGIAAIDHGADAVYVGAPRFSARANAGVDTKDLARLIRHAHFFYAKVYIALNTILTDDEIPNALRIIREVYDLGADGLILQDPGLLEMDLPPIPIIASTQMHNDTPEKIRFLEAIGFNRVILARELSLEEIRAIRRETRIELECFIHGALCVSYSGQCYMSHAVTGRSGNRGVCAQPCRSRYTLIDGNGNPVLSDKFLLSLRDLNRLYSIPDLAAAGITSFKIEGRYKEIDYVKNVTAAYRRALDAFIHGHPGYRRSSSGTNEISFLPDPSKTFNRGFTEYFLSGGRQKIASMDTQKSIGQAVGKVTGLGKGFFETDCMDLKNGDGLCFFTKKGRLSGFRIERVENSRIFFSASNHPDEGTILYRNYDIALRRVLQKNSGQRRIRVTMDFHQTDRSIVLTVRDEDGNQVESTYSVPYEEPKDPSMVRERIETQLSATGNSLFKVETFQTSGRTGFLSVGFLNTIRRDALSELAKIRMERYPRETAVLKPNSAPYPDRQLDYHANVMNSYARRFYQRHGAEVLEPAYEILPRESGKEIMKTRYCLRYELDACMKAGSSYRRIEEPLTIRDGRHQYLLKFDCEACTMSLIFLGSIPTKRPKRRRK